MTRGVDWAAVHERLEKVMTATPLELQIRASRLAAHAKHGENSIEMHAPDSPKWLPILGEEYGEVCRALTYDSTVSLRAELIDVAAVAMAWIDSIDRSTRPSPPEESTVE